jgi:hypothetical protein
MTSEDGKTVLLRYNAVFQPNAEDRRHCSQACFIMAVATLEGRKLSFGEVDQITGFKPGVLTWPFQSYLGYERFGLRVEVIEAMDFRAFAHDPELYIRNEYPSPKVQKEMLDNLDVPKERQAVLNLLETPSVRLTCRVPTIDDISESLQTGGVPIVSVNYWALRSDPDRYLGHAVIVVGMDETHVTVADPGPPGNPSFRVTKNTFLEALYGDEPKAASMRAIYPSRT